MKFWVMGIIVAVLITSAVIYFSFDKIAVYVISRLYDLDISYKKVGRSASAGYAFENMKLINKKMGIGFYSAQGSLKPVWNSRFLRSLDVEFKFKDVHFIKAKTDEVRARYETLDEIVSMPFEGRWQYKEVFGEVEIFSNGITVKKFSAEGREIRLIISGDIYYNNVVNTDITIYFSKEVLKDIPPELSGVIMKDEPREWKSFSVKMKGDLDSPSLQITGKMFRLNVGTIVMKE